MERILPAQHFVKRLKGTSDEVWSTLITGNHATEKHTVEDWHKVISNYKTQPAHPAQK